MTVRIAVLGLGRIGELHARNLAASGLVEGLLLCDADESRARGMAAELDAVAVASLDEVLAAGVEGVVVATPTPSHAQLVAATLGRGVAVFCEKPLAASLEAAEALAADAEALGVPLQVGMQRRCDPQLAEVRAQLARRAEGRLLGLRVVSTSWQPPPPPYLATSGGFFQDKLLHDVDVVRWATGREIEVAAVVGSGTATGWIGDAGDVDTVAVSLLLSGDVVAQIWAARSAPTRFEFRLDAVSERGTATVGRWTEGDPAVSRRRVSPHPTFVARFAGAYAREIAAFCGLVAGTGENVCGAADAVASMAATALVERAWREGRVVRTNGAGLDAGG